MKLFFLFVFLLLLIFLLSKREKFQSQERILNENFPDLIDDKRKIFFSKLLCLDYEDIKI